MFFSQIVKKHVSEYFYCLHVSFLRFFFLNSKVLQMAEAGDAGAPEGESETTDRKRNARPSIQIYRPGMMKRGTDITLLPRKEEEKLSNRPPRMPFMEDRDRSGVRSLHTINSVLIPKAQVNFFQGDLEEDALVMTPRRALTYLVVSSIKFFYFIKMSLLLTSSLMLMI